MRLLGDSWYAVELGVPTLEDLQLPRWLAAGVRNRVLRGIALWWFGRGCDRLVLSDGGLTFRVVMLLERLRPRRRPYLVLLEFRPMPLRPPSTAARSRLRPWLRAAYQRLIVRPVVRSALHRAHTLSSWEVERNALELGVARERLAFIPFPLTAAGDELPPIDGRGRRVIASGRTLCDWPLVFAAADGQSWELEIICDARERPAIERLNTNGSAQIRAELPLQAHRERLTQAAVFLLALQEGEVSSGHMRVFDATRAGAPLVAADVRGLSDYVEHGRNALLFAPGDARAARAAVNRLLDDQPLADELRRSAFEYGRQRTRERYLEEISALIHGG